ncbi:MAG: LuxR C-terminal-related transcriptional regulator [Actinomycetota bacterium]|nr:LuxR C-terminal-related transcriptional regulator [Actinomycetota bacterium]
MPASRTAPLHSGSSSRVMTRAGVSPVMVGRVGPLARLTGLVEVAKVASGDEPAVGMVSGEPGIGKTRLIEEFVSAAGGPSAEDVSVRSHVVGAQPGSLNRSYDTLSSLIDALGVDRSAELDRALVDAIAGELKSGPVVLVVEDVHWIDADSASLVDLLARRPVPGLVIVVTYRNGALRRGAPGGELVARLERGHGVEQIRLERLDRHEVGAMVFAITGEQPSSALVDAVSHRSEGNPFVVEELVRSVRGGDKDSRHDEVAAISSAALPWSLSDAVRQQLSDLSNDSRRVVEALAIFDDAASFDTMQTVTELDGSRLLAALRELVADGVVDEVSDDRFWFAHTLMADTVAGELLGRERRRLHERSLMALGGTACVAERTAEVHHSGGLADEPPDFAALVHHAVGAGRFDDVADIARIGARVAIDSGRTFLALRLAAQGLDEEPDDPLLLAVATEAAWRLDFLLEASETADRWVRASSGATRVDALRMVSRVWIERGDIEQAEVALDGLVSIADDGEALEVRAMASASIAQLYMIMYRSAEAVEWADRAIGDAATLGDAAIDAKARVERASALGDMLSRELAEPELRDAIERARAAQDVVATARGLNNLLSVLPPHSADGRQLVGELEAIAKRAGFDKMGAMANAWACSAAVGAGDLAAARRLLSEAWSSWMQVGTGSWTRYIESFIAIEEGRFADATAMLSEISGPEGHLFVGGKDEHEVMERLGLWSLLAAYRGDHRMGHEVFERMLTSVKPHARSQVGLVMAVESSLMVGVPPRRVRDELSGPWREALVGPDDVGVYVDGLLAAHAGEHERAVALLVPALDDGAPDEQLTSPTRAGLRMALATSLLALGDRTAAVAVVDAIIDGDLAKWPGVRRDRAEELRRRLVPRIDARSRSANAADAGPGAELTRREREVAVLLADGLTNGQLAERLFISPKTAAVHVSNILAKLGLSSRAEIAAWAVRNLPLAS